MIIAPVLQSLPVALLEPSAVGIELIAASLISALLTGWVLRYARVRMLDLPGRRRSHAQPTPRGGGLAPVLVWLLGVGLLAIVSGPGIARQQLWVLIASCAMIAAISWVDDHRPLPILPRVGVHLAAALLVVLGSLGPADSLGGWADRGVFLFALFFATNFWNFMDGIDGLASVQSLFCAFGLGLAALFSGAPQLALVAFLLVAALAGFLPFNAPKARIFLGDVGSTTLGFAIAAMGVLGYSGGLWGWSLWPLLATTFLLDAGLTLTLRWLRGRRWYTPHREHLYQWMVRRGFSHPRTVALYLAWNFIIIVPAALIWFRAPSAGGWLWAAVWLLTATVWWRARRWLLRRPDTTDLA